MQKMFAGLVTNCFNSDKLLAFVYSSLPSTVFPHLVSLTVPSFYRSRGYLSSSSEQNVSNHKLRDIRLVQFQDPLHGDPSIQLVGPLITMLRIKDPCEACSLIACEKTGPNLCEKTGPTPCET